MGKRVRVAAALVICLLILAACGVGSRPDGLPDPLRDNGGPGPSDDQPWLPPITFSIDTNGKITVANERLVTRLGNVTVDGDNVTNPDGTTLRPNSADVTHLVICQQDSTRQRCQAYQIGTGRPIRIELNGSEVLNWIIPAAPGSTISVTDNGRLPTLKAHGPASIDRREFHFQEAGQETAIDLERSHPGTTADLSYDHFTGELKPINGAEVLLYVRDSLSPWDWPHKRSDYPGEQDCRERRPEDWRGAFSKDDLKAEFSIFCIKTADGNVGFLFIKPDPDLKPVGYYVYAHTWVR